MEETMPEETENLEKEIEVPTEEETEEVEVETQQASEEHEEEIEKYLIKKIIKMKFHLN